MLFISWMFHTMETLLKSLILFTEEIHGLLVDFPDKAPLMYSFDIPLIYSQENLLNTWPGFLPVQTLLSRDQAKFPHPYLYIDRSYTHANEMISRNYIHTTKLIVDCNIQANEFWKGWHLAFTKVFFSYGSFCRWKELLRDDISL